MSAGNLTTKKRPTREEYSLEADAARYRWLRDNYLVFQWYPVAKELPDGGWVLFRPHMIGEVLSYHPESKDAAIDAAMESK